MNSSDIILHFLIGPLILLFSFIYILFPPKNINTLYGHRTKISMLNKDTWYIANKLSSKMMLFISVLTCAVQIICISIGIKNENIILFSTILLVIGLIIGMLLVEKELRKIFDNQGNRK